MSHLPTTAEHTRLWPRLVGAILVLLLAACLLIGARAGLLARQAYVTGLDLRTLVGTDLSAADLPLLQARTSDLAQTLDRLNRTVRPFAAVLRALEWVPSYGAMLAATPQLLEIGSEFALLGNEILTIATPHLGEQGEVATFDNGVAVLNGGGGQLRLLAPRAALLSAQIAALPVDDLPPTIAGRLLQLQQATPLMSAGLQMAPQLPALIGFKGRQTYLILVQNNHELRATGGFITAIGTITVEEGEILDLDFVDSYKLVSEDGAYPNAPEAMQRYMGIPIMLLRDVNWSPDLPTTAQLALALYEQETGIVADGIVTVDLDAVAILVDALGPLRTPGTETPITGDNVIELVKQFWDQPVELQSTEKDNEWWRQRKDFMPTLAAAALQRLESGKVDTLALLQAGQLALERRSVQIWLPNPEIEPVLAGLGWDGRLNPPRTGDYLALIDTNMGYNKVDSVIQRRIIHSITWPQTPGEAAQASTTIVYRHPLDVPNHACDITPRYGLTYDDMTMRCYFNFVRLYTPGGSTLVDTSGLDEAFGTGQRAEGGAQVFSGYMVLRPGKERVVTFNYLLPPSITEENYSLVIQRQSGSAPLTVGIDVRFAAIETEIERGRFSWSP